MRVRRRHAWGAVLIVLFALPVMKPEGIPALERPVAGFFAWFSGLSALNPELWGSSVAEGDDQSPRALALEEENAVLRELYAERLGLESDVTSLSEVFQQAALDRLPRAVSARVLRTADPAGFRRSILIDRGAADGLESGLAVVSGSVFLGRVETVQARSAQVKLVSDRRSRLEVALRTDSGERLCGYVQGSGRGAIDGELEIRQIVVPPEAGRIPLGASVLTSNADPRVPAGLVVGTVTAVSDKDLAGLPIVRMRPALDLGRSTTVLVLLPTED
jgi:cell shape-determining protein MreC